MEKRERKEIGGSGVLALNGVQSEPLHDDALHATGMFLTD